MPKFRKKPVVIEAWQWNGEKAGEMPGICQCDSNTFPHLHTAHENTIDDRGQLVFLTKGDWIIPEAKKEGRYYPCKPDVFAETYEPASPPIMAELTPDLEGVLRQEMGRPGLIIYDEPVQERSQDRAADGPAAGRGRAHTAAANAEIERLKKRISDLENDP